MALRLVELIARLIVGLSHGLEIGLDVPQISGLGLQVQHGLLHLLLQTKLIGSGFAAAQEPELVLLERDIGLQRLVLLGHLGLTLQLVQVGVEFAQDVFHPREIFTRVAQAVLGLATTLLVLRDPGGFLEKQPQFLGLGFDDAADRALADDGIGARAQSSAEKHVLHVSTPHRLVVDVVAAGAVTGQHALDGDLGELVPLTAGTVVCVVEHQFHTGSAGGLSGGGAIEDHVLHGLATQLAGATLAQHPAHRIHDVRLATPVGSHHAHELARQHEIGGFDERLETREFDRGETHRRPLSSKVFSSDAES